MHAELFFLETEDAKQMCIWLPSKDISRDISSVLT